MKGVDVSYKCIFIYHLRYLKSFFFLLNLPGLKNQQGDDTIANPLVWMGCVGVWGSVYGCVICVCVLQFGQAFVYWVSFKKVKFDHKQTWVKATIGVSSYVNEVKNYVELFLCELLSYSSSGLIFIIQVFFKKLKSDRNQTWLKDAI